MLAVSTEAAWCGRFRPAMPIMFSKHVLSLFPLSLSRDMYEPVHKYKYALIASYFDQMAAVVPKLSLIRNLFAADAKGAKASATAAAPVLVGASHGMRNAPAGRRGWCSHALRAAPAATDGTAARSRSRTAMPSPPATAKSH